MPQPSSCTVEIVTPAFPGGPEHPRDSAAFEGVRPTSIVYGMRWWFRALAATVLGTANLPAIREAESKVFGSSQPVHPEGADNPLQNGVRSRVRLALRDNVDLGKCLPFEERDIALRYLTYGLYPTASNEQWRRKFIPPGEKFTFEYMILPPNGACPWEVPKPLVEALARLWVEFGGLGARWRHGFGAMRSVDQPVATAAEYGKQAAGRISAARELMKEFLQSLGYDVAAPRNPPGLPAFAVAAEPHLQLAWREDAGADWRQALKTVFNLWRGSRLKDPGNPRSSTWNAGLYADFLRGNKPHGQQAQLAGLGLPIPFGFPLGGQGIPRDARGLLTPRLTERRASPIWLRPVRVARRTGTGYGLFALLWNCQYLDAADEVVISPPGKKDDPQVAGARVAVSFDADDARQWFQGFLLGGPHYFRRV